MYNLFSKTIIYNKKSMEFSLNLNLNSNEINKLNNGKNVQLKAEQLNTGHFKVTLRKTLYKKMLRLKNAGKGIRINQSMFISMNNGQMDGSGKYFMNAAQLYGGKKQHHMNGGAMSAKEFGNKLVQGLEFSKKHVPKKLVKQAVQTGLNTAMVRYGGVDPALANQMSSSLADNSVNAVYNTDFNDKNAIKQAGQQFAMDTGKDALLAGTNYLEQKLSGGGRKQKGGKLSLGQIGQTVKKIVPKKVATQLATQALNAGLEKAGVQSDLAKTMSQSLVKNSIDATYATDLSQGSAMSNFKNIGMNTGLNTAKDGIDYGVNSYVNNNSTGGSYRPNGGNCCLYCGSKRKSQKGGSFLAHGRKY